MNAQQLARRSPALRFKNLRAKHVAHVSGGVHASERQRSQGPVKRVHLHVIHAGGISFAARLRLNPHTQLRVKEVLKVEFISDGNTRLERVQQALGKLRTRVVKDPGRDVM